MIKPVGAMVMGAVLFAGACAGKSPEPARPEASAQPSPPPAASTPSSPPAVSAEPPAPPAARASAAQPSSGAAGGGASEKPSARPIGTKLMQDAADSPKAYKLSKDDGSGHGLGSVQLTVDGQSVWPPQGPGCPELVRCCTELVERDASLALACQLAVGRDPDCATALRTSAAVAGESGVALPAACPR